MNLCVCLCVCVKTLILFLWGERIPALEPERAKELLVIRVYITRNICNKGNKEEKKNKEI